MSLEPLNIKIDHNFQNNSFTNFQYLPSPFTAPDSYSLTTQNSFPIEINPSSIVPLEFRDMGLTTEVADTSEPPLVPMQNKEYERLFNEMLKDEFWQDVEPKDVRKKGKPYEYFYYKVDDEGRVMPKITGSVDIPIEVVAQVVFNEESKLEGTSVVTVGRKFNEEPYYDSELQVSHNNYYFIYNATLFYLKVVDRVYIKHVSDDQIIVWYEKLSPSADEQKQIDDVGFKSMRSVVEPKHFFGGYIFKRDPNNPQRTLVTSVVYSQFDNGLLNWISGFQPIVLTGFKTAFEDYESLANKIWQEQK